MRPLQSRSFRRAFDTASLVALVGGTVVAALAFAWPWLPPPPPGGAILARYSPLQDGSARLLRRSAADGTLSAIESQNHVLVPALRLYSDLRRAPSDAILELYPMEQISPRRLTYVNIFETRTRRLGSDGQITSLNATVVREPRGELIISLSDPAHDQDLIFSPPALLLPADLEPGHTWESEGQFGAAQYTFRGRVLESGSVSSALGAFDDCLHVESWFLTVGAALRVESTTRIWYCAGVGIVETRDFDAHGQLTDQAVVIAADGALAAPPAQPAIPSNSGVPAVEAFTDPATWQLQRIGRSQPTGDAGESTIAPVWVPTDPPMLLAASFEGDLVAFDAASPQPTILWSFHPTGTIYGPPTFDPVRSRVYFGASDKRLYALDTHGFFLWSFRSGDNVATRPLVVGDVVIFGGEDRTIYGLDAATGAQRWARTVGGPVVSWPALVGDMVIIGSDDQTAYALDPATGRVRWTYSASGPIEAPIVVDGDTVFVASRGGTVAALDASTCAAICQAVWESNTGERVRTAPAVGAGHVFVVDDDGDLIALDRDGGRQLWETRGGSYVGPPVLVGETLMVGLKSGAVEGLALDGTQLGRWALAEATIPSDGQPELTHGPTIGGNSLWLGDTRAVLRRLGPPPPISDVASIPLVWFKTMIEPPFEHTAVSNTAVPYQEKVVLVDSGRNILLLDPATGEGTRRGTLAGTARLTGVDPVVVDDLLLATTGESLRAASLQDGRNLWEFQAGTNLLPAAVSGDTVIWLVSDDAEGGVVYSIDRGSGEQRWQVSLGALIAPGGAAIRGDPSTGSGQGLALLSTPPVALDLATGQPRWRAEVQGSALGGPGIDPSGAAMYVGLLSDAAGGSIAAIDTASGAVRWQVPLVDDVLRVTEAPWVSGETVIVPGLSGQVIALDAASGTERWRFKPPATRLGSITVADGRVWLATEDAGLFALDAETGRLRARFAALQLDLSGEGVSQRPAIFGQRVILPLGLMVLAFDIAGER